MGRCFVNCLSVTMAKYLTKATLKKETGLWLMASVCDLSVSLLWVQSKVEHHGRKVMTVKLFMSRHPGEQEERGTKINMGEVSYGWRGGSMGLLICRRVW